MVEIVVVVLVAVGCANSSMVGIGTQLVVVVGDCDSFLRQSFDAIIAPVAIPVPKITAFIMMMALVLPLLPFLLDGIQ